MTQSVPKIDSLVLTGCYNLTDEKLTPAFGHENIYLTQLNLSMCKQLTDRSILKIVNNLKNLESLDIGGCGNLTNSALVAIEQGLRTLRRLNLRSCRNVTDSGIGRLCGQSAEDMLGKKKEDAPGGCGPGQPAAAQPPVEVVERRGLPCLESTCQNGGDLHSCSSHRTIPLLSLTLRHRILLW